MSGTVESIHPGITVYRQNGEPLKPGDVVTDRERLRYDADAVALAELSFRVGELMRIRWELPVPVTARVTY